MDLMFKDLLKLNKAQIKNSKVEFNMKAGKDGENYIDLWLKHSDEEKESGTCRDCSYWGWYSGNRRNFVPGNVVFSFARIDSDNWLFVSAARIIDVPRNQYATVEILKEYQPLFGRLIVKFKKGNTFYLYTFTLEKYLDAITVKEILPCIYSGEKFEGYDKTHLPYNRLKLIFDGKIMPTYYEALKKITGVYCLTDTNTGKLYIGSATGGEGVAQRWGNYLNSMHGDNVKLIRLYKEKGEAYFEKYFTYTLLEYFGLSYDPDRIREREQYWKKCLDTINNGYNGN